jgi:exosortase A-associated hydrolase 2
VQAEAFFMRDESPQNSQLFCLFYPAQGGLIRGLVLYIHPFAEEMNKARRMAALQARELARSGFSVLQIDLLGCGDSSGDFSDATWQSWVHNVVQASHWLRHRSNLHGAVLSHVPLWLWGLRSGCLVAVEAANKLNEACNFLFWQPAVYGKPLLQQFLRLKLASNLLNGSTQGLMEDLRQQLAHGGLVDVAGYSLAAGLAMGLEQSVLIPPAHTGQTRRLAWFEVVTREDASLNPNATKAIDQWQQSGFTVSCHLVRGPAFWQSTEIEEAPLLIAATTAAISAL